MPLSVYSFAKCNCAVPHFSHQGGLTPQNPNHEGAGAKHAVFSVPGLCKLGIDKSTQSQGSYCQLIQLLSLVQSLEKLMRRLQSYAPCRFKDAIQAGRHTGFEGSHSDQEVLGASADWASKSWLLACHRGVVSQEEILDSYVCHLYIFSSMRLPLIAT